MVEINALAKERPEILTPAVVADFEAQLRHSVTAQRDAFDELIMATEGFGRDFSRTLAEGLADGEFEWRDFLHSLVVDLNEFAIQELITDPLLGVFKKGVIDPLKKKGEGLFSSGDTGEPPPSPFTGTGTGVGETQDLGKFLGILDQAGENLSGVATDTETGFANLIQQLGHELTETFGTLSGTISTIFGGLLDFFFGGKGFSWEGLGLAVLGGALKGLSSGAHGGGGPDVGPVLPPENPQFGVTGHTGGLIAALYHSGGLRRGEVPAILEEGELVIPRGLTAQLLDVMDREPAIRRYHDGGLVAEMGGGLRRDSAMSDLRNFSRAPSARGGAPIVHNTYNNNVTVPYQATSLDPRTHAQLLRQEAETIANIVLQKINSGGALAAAVGQRVGF